MSKQTLVIPGNLVDLNSYIRMERGNRYIAAKAKRAADALVAQCCKSQGIRKVSGAAYLEITYYDRDARIDNDNRAFTKKSLLDGLTLAGVLAGDSRRYLLQPVPWSEAFYVDKDKPRTEVVIHDRQKG